MTPRHSGCAICGGVSEEILTSGRNRDPSGKVPSLAVCSKKTCRAAVEFAREE